MLFLKYLIILSFIGCAFGGGTSTCSRLREAFVQMLSASQSSLERLANKTVANSISYPAVENSLVSELLCNLDTVIDILAEGTSQVAEVDVAIIAEILRGRSSEFPFPLSCIKKEMLSFIAITDFILQNTYSSLKSVSQPALPTFNDSCGPVVNYASVYYRVLDQYIDSRIFNNLADAAEFRNIGKFDLYLKHHNSINNCTMITLAKAVAELFNSDENKTIEFITNQSIELPKPLNCISGLFGSGIAQVKLGNIEFSKTVFNFNHQEACLPLAHKFDSFVNVWSGYVDKLQTFAIENTLKNPTLTSSFITDFECETRRMLIFATNASSLLSGVLYDEAFNILNNPLAPPFEMPLDCIADDLIYIRNSVWTILKSVAPELKAFKVASTGKFESCYEVVSTFENYANPLRALVSSREAITANFRNEFESINMKDPFLASLISNGDCLPNFLGSYISSVLNSNSTDLLSYLNGSSDNLSYPFNCIKSIIDTLKNMANHTVTEYRASVLDASMPVAENLFG